MGVFVKRPVFFDRLSKKFFDFGQHFVVQNCPFVKKVLRFFRVFSFVTVIERNQKTSSQNDTVNFFHFFCGNRA